MDLSIFLLYSLQYIIRVIYRSMFVLFQCLCLSIKTSNPLFEYLICIDLTYIESLKGSQGIKIQTADKIYQIRQQDNFSLCFCV